MILFPPAKINLGLNVVRKRADGFHDIETVMIPIPLHDILEVVVDRGVPKGRLEFTRTGLGIPGDKENDLCVKAVAAMRRLDPLPGLRIHLHKVIPTGAGLGGGSSDAAHTLLALNNLLQIATSEQLHAMATSLGSDVPFFLNAQAQLARGRGEFLEPIDVDLKGVWLIIVNPGIHVPTAEVYRSIIPSERSIDLSAILSGSSENWQSDLINAMEISVLNKYPMIASIKQKLLDAGAFYSAMSGSGSTVFALFRSEPPNISWPTDHFIREFRL